MWFDMCERVATVTIRWVAVLIVATALAVIPLSPVQRASADDFPSPPTLTERDDLTYHDIYDQGEGQPPYGKAVGLTVLNTYSLYESGVTFSKGQVLSQAYTENPGRYIDYQYVDTRLKEGGITWVMDSDDCSSCQQTETVDTGVYPSGLPRTGTRTWRGEGNFSFTSGSWQWSSSTWAECTVTHPGASVSCTHQH